MILMMALPILLIFVTMRGQSKKQKQLESSLKTGDTVTLQSGIIGKITELGERTAKVEIAPGVQVKVLKTSIQGIDPGDSKPAETKADKPAEKKA